MTSSPALANAAPAQLLPTRAKPFSPDLRNRLATYAAEHALTNTQLARELACSPTAVSKYLNGKPEGDVARLESIVEDVLKSSVRRAALGVEIFETSVTQQIGNMVETVRRVNGCGLITAPAGTGKTCAVALYAAQTPSAICVDLRAWNATREGVQGLLFRSVENRAWDGRTRRADFLVERLRGSGRVIVLDNAHKLTRGAREWLLDFHEETKCPLIFLGREPLRRAFDGEPDQFSFFTVASDVRFRGDEADTVARLLESRLPQVTPELAEMAHKVAQGNGGLRALTNQLALAQDLAALPEFKGQPALAFRSAHSISPASFQI